VNFSVLGEGELNLQQTSDISKTWDKQGVITYTWHKRM
jgi:hypothetical protein